MDREIERLVELLSMQVPQAPGSERSTLRALAALGRLPDRPRVVDLGCGRGASALVLARATGGTVLALDLLPAMVSATKSRAEAAGLTEQVQAVAGDMGAPPVAPGSVDLLWSEGAAYSIGFERALRQWRPLLAPGGGICVSELCWKDGAVPEAARAYWAGAYPDMTEPHRCRSVFEAAGYHLVDSFFLPDEDWAAYYEPLVAHLPAFRAAHHGDPVAQAVADELETEIAAWRQWGASYGYLFLVGRAK